MKKNPHAFVAIADHTVGFAGTAVPAVGFRGPLRKSVEKRENKTYCLIRPLRPKSRRTDGRAKVGRQEHGGSAP
jgi:hypothetical protein